MFQANVWGILAIVAVTMCWVLAVVLFRVSTPGSVARKLSLLLVIEGLTLGTSDAPRFILTSPEDFVNALPPLVPHILSYTHLFGDCAMLVLYPIFLSAALMTGMTRPIENKWVRTGLLVSAVLMFLFVIFDGFEKISVSLLYASMVVTFTYALIASIQAWHTSAGAARSRALIFVLAFGFRDICWGYNYAFAISEMWSGSRRRKHIR